MKALHVYSPSVLEDFTSGLPVLSDMPLSKFLCFQYLAILWSLNALTSISLKISSPSYLSLLFPWSKLTLKIPYPTLQPLPPIYPTCTSSYPTLTIFRIYWILSPFNCHLLTSCPYFYAYPSLPSKRPQFSKHSILFSYLPRKTTILVKSNSCLHIPILRK